jgi:hypothetical protein
MISSSRILQSKRDVDTAKLRHDTTRRCRLESRGGGPGNPPRTGPDSVGLFEFERCSVKETIFEGIVQVRGRWKVFHGFGVAIVDAFERLDCLLES